MFMGWFTDAVSVYPFLFTEIKAMTGLEALGLTGLI